jgi:hypothetical protein
LAATRRNCERGRERDREREREKKRDSAVERRLVIMATTCGTNKIAICPETKVNAGEGERGEREREREQWMRILSRWGLRTW